MNSRFYIDKMIIIVDVLALILGLLFALPIGIYFAGNISEHLISLVIVVVSIGLLESVEFYIVWKRLLKPIELFLQNKEVDIKTRERALLLSYNAPSMMMILTMVHFFIPSIVAGIMLYINYNWMFGLRIFLIGFIFGIYSLPVVLTYSQNYLQTVTEALYKSGVEFKSIQPKIIRITLVRKLVLLFIENLVIFSISGYLVNKSIIPMIMTIIFATFVNAIVLISYTKQLNHLMNNVKNIIESGNISERIHIYVNDETAGIISLFNNLVEMLLKMINKMMKDADKLAGMADNLSSSTEEMNASVEEISATVQEIARGASEQAEDTVKMNEGAEELTEISENIVSQVKRANISAIKAKNASIKGRETSNNTKEAMDLIYSGSNESQERIEQLKNRSEEIDEIIDVIKNITNQTDLLALNASIEAARVGEYGAGFAVVAEEIRNLANSSQESTEKISKLISDIKADVEQVVESMNKVSQYVEDGKKNVDMSKENFVEIEKNVTITEDMIKEVTESIEKQNGFVLNLAEKNKSLSEISNETAASTEETSASLEEQMASMQEISASAAELHKLAQDLRNLEQVFTEEKDETGK
ncbi:MAG: hypothetical protein GWP03_06560 [Proteobacteria bacterium]|nr:hypothetical protein [Pseudomonadota bacterium]